MDIRYLELRIPSIIVQVSYYYTCLDPMSNYHQVQIDEAVISKMAFAVLSGLYENAPATFELSMDLVLSSLREFAIFCYLDNILISSKTLDLHLER